MKVRNYIQGRHLSTVCVFNCIADKESECGRLRICDSERAKEAAQECYHQSTRMGKKTEVQEKKKEWRNK